MSMNALEEPITVLLPSRHVSTSSVLLNVPALVDTIGEQMASVQISTNALPEAILALPSSRLVSITLVLSAAHVLLDMKETLTKLA